MPYSKFILNLYYGKSRLFILREQLLPVPFTLPLTFLPSLSPYSASAFWPRRSKFGLVLYFWLPLVGQCPWLCLPSGGGAAFIWFRVLFLWRQRFTSVYLICDVGRSVFLQCCNHVCAANVCMFLFYMYLSLLRVFILTFCVLLCRVIVSRVCN